MPPRFIRVLFELCWLAGSCAAAQSTMSARIEYPAGKQAATPHNAVLWLEPVAANLRNVEWPAHPPYRLVQKARTFSPHLLVVPVGATVSFPNADPFFHNVFSLFEGRRFDLGLYEAGSSRDVTFSRKGVSYIFCNIHPEMGAVVLALDTPLWATASGANEFTLRNVPTGTYEVNIWVEGQPQALLTRWKHRAIALSAGVVDAGTFHVEAEQPAEHTDKFGREYKRNVTPY